MKSALQGNATAQKSLGDIYLDDQDYEQAINWYKKASLQGDVISQFTLGQMYLKGPGSSQDFELVYYAGYKRAEGLRSEIELEMSAAQITEAKKLVNEWRTFSG